MLERFLAAAITAVVVLGASLPAQTTQGLIRGRVYDRETGNEVPAVVTYVNLATNDKGETETDPLGYYALTFLSPGTYRLRVTDRVADPNQRYQAQEVHELDLFVSARLEIDFALRPLATVLEKDVSHRLSLADNSSLVHFFGPDLEAGRRASLRLAQAQTGPLHATLSYVIDPQQVENLPLAGRDIYTMLVAQPGVTTDNATARGLGLSVNGQRPSSTSFLLDGVEYNDQVVTGPLAPLAPESVQEYRVSTNNFSAEFGGTGGLVANAVTRAGPGSFHGLFYGYLGNDALNANLFQNNANGRPRPPRKELHAGYWAGGPIRRERLFFSSAWERLRSRSAGDTRNFGVPSARFVESLPQNSLAAALLTLFPAPTGIPTSNPDVAVWRVAPPDSRDRSLALERIDYRPPGGQRLMGHLALSRFSRPDFLFSPYQDFRSPLTADATSAVLSYIRSVPSRSLNNELKFAWQNRQLGWRRPHPEIPTLLSVDALLPGSAASYEYRGSGDTWEVDHTLALSRGRHLFTAGGGLLLRRSGSLLSYGRDGLYQFNNLRQFASGMPVSFRATASREHLLDPSPRLESPRYDRDYANNQFFLFGQDHFKVGARLALSLGLRYESFGSPTNTGVQDGFLEPTEAGAVLRFDPARRRAAYRPDRNNWAGRAGVSYDLFGGGKTLWRAAYGIFYDRPFDNLTQNTRNNSLQEVTQRFSVGPINFLRPIGQVLAPLDPFRYNQNPGNPEVLWVDDRLRAPYVQSWFAGIQQQVSRAFYFEISHLGAAARRLVATDLVNRPELERGQERPSPTLPDVQFRSNSGSSNYTALGALARYRSSRAQFQAAYTWGHSIDNQSDALLGDFFDLGFTGGGGDGRPNLAAFTRQYDSRLDRGSSDFDQRHNLVLYSIWELPGIVRHPRLHHFFGGWQLAQLAGLRSGFPYTVFLTSGRYSDSVQWLVRNRPNLLHSPRFEDRREVPGGVQLLDRSAFGPPEPGVPGDLRRNSLIGPGFWNLDVSARKSFSFPWLGEAGSIQVRLDFFNLFNHTNLGDPERYRSSQAFGRALYGRSGRSASFPAVTPLNESPRQIQIQFKVHF